jgi:outer membrane biosynthesis protein TonB
MAIYEASFLGEPVPIKPIKRQKKAAPVPEAVPEVAPVEVAPAQPKPKRIPKRKEPVPPVEAPAPIPVAAPVAEPIPEPKRKVRVTAPKPTPVLATAPISDEPPAWFKAYMHDEAKRKNDDKPKKEKAAAPVVKQEAVAAATAKWSDGFTKARVNNEVDAHMSRLYNQIHSRRL